VLVGKDRREQRHDLRERDDLHGERGHGSLRHVLGRSGALSHPAEAAERAGMDDSFAFRITLQPGYTFVDGPSTAPTVVSIASTADTWAAAVQGSGGMCHWTRATSAGNVSHGIGTGCTGAAALVPSTLWPSTAR